MTDTDRTLLSGAMDRLVPLIDDLPGAGTMGLVPEVEALARRHGPYGRALGTFLEKLAARWSADLSPGQQDGLLRDLEASDGASFGAVLELVYLAYYSDPRVQRRIGWRGGPLQPEGFPLAPFDPDILETARKRRPFWREA